MKAVRGITTCMFVPAVTRMNENNNYEYCIADFDVSS